MVIFHSYLSLPEGTSFFFVLQQKKHQRVGLNMPMFCHQKKSLFLLAYPMRFQQFLGEITGQIPEKLLLDITRKISYIPSLLRRPRNPWWSLARGNQTGQTRPESAATGPSWPYGLQWAKMGPWGDATWGKTPGFFMGFIWGIFLGIP